MSNKRKAIIAIAAIVLAIVAVLIIKKWPFGESSNLIENGDFENWFNNSPSKWSVYNYQKEFNFDSSASEITKVTENGNSYLCIENKVENDLRFKQKLKVKPSTTYKITADFKIEGEINEGDAANLSIIDSSIRLGSSITRNTDSEWKTVEVYGVTGEDQEELEFAVGLGGYGSTSIGKIYIDNVKFEKVSAAPDGVKIEKLYKEIDEENIHRPIIPAKIGKVIFITCAFLLAIYLINMILKKKEQERAGISNPNKESEWLPTKKLLSKYDVIIMTVMTVAYLLLALYYLGDRIAPQTYYEPEKIYEYVTVSFGEEKNLGRVLYNCNIPKNTSNKIVSYYMEYLDETGEFVKFYDVKEKAFYEWMYKDTNISTSQVRITMQTPGFKINEIGFLEKADDLEAGYKVIDTVEIIDTNGSREGFEKWFDEQFTVPIRPSVLNGTYFDEIYFPRTAYEHLNNLPIYETTHPPLGKIIQAMGIAIFGMTPFGWRIMGTLFGVAMIPVIYAFAKKLFNKTSYAFIAAFLITFDTMHFAQTRLATIDSYSTLFIMLMYFFMYDFFITKSYELDMKYSLIPLFLSGLFFGLGAATKWICIYTGLGLAIVFFISWLLEMESHRYLGVINPEIKNEPKYKRYWSYNVNLTFWSCILFFVIIPLIIYLLSYIPYVRVEGVNGSLVEVAWQNQKSMFSYHSKLTAPHGYSSEWFTWPLNIRPIWYYNGHGLPEGVRETIASFGNPLVWIPGIISFFASMYIAYKKSDFKMIVVFVAFACQFMPWILVTRATFIYHYFSCVPFIILSIVYVIKHLLETKAIKPRTVIIYLVLVFLTFVAFYPAITGIPVAESYIEKLRILPSWYF